MPLKTKRWDDPVEPGDGLRVLVCRYRPRALPKAKETWDVWYADLGPSKALHRRFYAKSGEPLPWEEYEQQYLKEMQTQQKRIARLAQLVRQGFTMTLLCSSACEDPARCHRTLLQQLIETQMQNPSLGGVPMQPDFRDG